MPIIQDNVFTNGTWTRKCFCNKYIYYIGIQLRIEFKTPSKWKCFINPFMIGQSSEFYLFIECHTRVNYIELKKLLWMKQNLLFLKWFFNCYCEKITLLTSPNYYKKCWTVSVMKWQLRSIFSEVKFTVIRSSILM